MHDSQLLHIGHVVLADDTQSINTCGTVDLEEMRFDASVLFAAGNTRVNRARRVSRMRSLKWTHCQRQNKKIRYAVF